MSFLTRQMIVAFSLASLALVSACTKEEAAKPPEAATASVISSADCDKLPDPKSSDESAAGRAAAVSQGAAARAACKRELASVDKGSDDLRRIREIKEIEQADKQARKVTEDQWRRDVKKGANAPLKQFNY